VTLPDAQQLRLVERADVFKRGERAATLTRTAAGIAFQYLPEWVANRRPAVATTLPVTPDPILYPGGGLPAYFSGLLPEGRRLGALLRAVKTSADD
jgi:serine/threonine-protein kinase HipA